MMRYRLILRATAAPALLAVALGCESAPGPTAELPVPGGTWNAVLPAEVAREQAAAPNAPESFRLDERLAVNQGDIYPLNQWPALPAPSASSTRIIQIPSSPSSTILFRSRYLPYSAYGGR